MATTIDVTDNAEAGRFEAHIGGELAGVVQYNRQGDRIVFTHTEVEDAFEGKGVGSALARGVLDTVRARGERAVVLCPFIARFVTRHAEYQDLVDDGPLGDA